MEPITDIFNYILSPNKRIFWGYLLSSIVIAWIYLSYNKKERPFNFSRALWLHPSSILDYKYFFISYFVKILFIFPIVVSAREVSLITYETFSETYGLIEIDFSYEMVMFLYTLCIFVVSDFSRYWLHRFLHTIPVLWEFHKVHHSAEVLNPLTFYRVHPIENILFGFRYSLSIGFVTGIFIFLFGGMIGVYQVLGVNIILFLFSLMGSNLRHSHIQLKYPTLLEKLFISPYQHQIHHSRKYVHKNFGGYLAIWDLLFGSIQYSKDVEKLKIGIYTKEYNSLVKLLFKPFYIVTYTNGILKLRKHFSFPKLLSYKKK